MRRVIHFTPAEIRPARTAVLHRQGMPLSGSIALRLQLLLDQAETVFEQLARPVAVFDEISHEDFGTVYAGAGRNAARTPLAAIVPAATSLALFAATVGADVDTAIRWFSRGRDVALAFTLDALASVAAETLADRVAAQYVAAIEDRVADAGPALRVLPYSPGYCGWHVSGQRALFDYLRPREIGIDVNHRCLMLPVKSVSGLLVAGSDTTHVFRPTYDCCRTCVTRHCHERMQSVRGG